VQQARGRGVGYLHARRLTYQASTRNNIGIRRTVAGHLLLARLSVLETWAYLPGYSGSLAARD